MKKKTQTKQQLLLETEELRSRLNVAEQRLEEDNEVIQAAMTDRKRAEEALKESETKFRDLSEHSLAGVYLMQQDGLLRYVNSRCAEIFGYKIEEVIDTLRVDDVIFPEDWPMVRESLRKRVSKTLLSDNYEFRIITKNRDIKYVEVYSSFTLYKGKPAVIGTLLDITERKRAEETLRNEKERFRTLSEEAPLGMVLIEQDGTFRYINSKFRELFGYELTDVPDAKT